MIYVLLFVYGVMIDLNGPANFIGVDDAGKWLNPAIGVVMLGIAFAFGGIRRPTVPAR